MRFIFSTLALCFVAATSFAQLTRQANTTLNFPATPATATGYTTTNAFGTNFTFSGPICLRTPPGVTDRIFVVERLTGVQAVTLATNTKAEFFNLNTILAAQPAPAPTISGASESGFLSMAFHPNFNQNGYFYIFHSLNIAPTVGGTTQLHQRIARLKANGTPGNYNAATSVDPASYTPMITQRDEAGNHNGGDMHFGADGYLYISVGDEGGASDQYDNARRIGKDFFGGMLRLDVDLLPQNLTPNPHTQSNSTSHASAIHPGTYKIPADNPFVNLPSVGGNTTYGGFTFPTTSIRTEFWAIGLRNPWRFSFDPPTGRLFVGDVGQGTREEVDILTAGAHSGWSWREGNLSYNPPSAPSTPPVGLTLTEPIYTYPHSGTSTFHGLSITGGRVYRGSALAELHGQYIFCDYSTGFVWALKENGATWTVSHLLTLAGFVAFGTDPRNGDILICNLNSNTVRRLTATTTGTAPPATLSATGAFTNLSTLAPAAGVVPYDVNLPFWSDYAIKSRWFSIPALADKMTFATEGPWTAAATQIWVKHFELETERGNPLSPRRRIETRFLVKNPTSSYGLTYRWREDGTEADLVGESGLDETFTVSVGGVPTAQTWRYPSRGECLQCHTTNAGFALSFHTRQLHRERTYGAQLLNQITALSGAGYFTAAAPSTQNLPTHARTDDSAASLEHRVRSYLAVNCSFCHQPGGPGQWDGRAHTATDLAGLINGPLNNDFGISAYRMFAPGSVGTSMAIQRLQGGTVPRMPPLGNNEVDAAAVSLFANWINQSLPARQSFAEWQTANFGSTSSADAQPDADPDQDGQKNRAEFLSGTSPLLAGTPLAATGSGTTGNFTLSFTHPANRSALVETSTDLQTWTLWAAPGNTPIFPSNNTSRVLTGPAPGANSYFRLRLGEL